MNISGRAGLIAAGALVAFAAWSCGGGESSPNPSPLVIAKAPGKSGDGQTAPPGSLLPTQLAVLITQDGNPVDKVTVGWATPNGGSLAPVSNETGADGIAMSAWTLGPGTGQQTATATVSGASGSPLGFTATASGGSPGNVTINVVNNLFQPSVASIAVGTTVTWQWSAAARTHNVVPDDGATPPMSGPPTDGPHSYSFTFDTPGTYHYHCQTHGGVNGFGMSGTITVLSGAP
jgi:plastocyanin